MASSSSGWVAGLTAAALATVGFLGRQASVNAPAELTGAPVTASPGPGMAKAPRDGRDPTALPAASGSGERVVYSVDDDRVWLVGARGEVRRTFRVTPGSYDPELGTYTVSSRALKVTGTDGTPVQHVVRFASVDGRAIGFSAARDGSTEPPLPSVHTGAIREARADGAAMWDFATIGRRVVVIR